MFRSLDHPQRTKLFLAKVTSKTFIKFLYVNRVLWQHDVLCKIALLGMCLGMVCVMCYLVRDLFYVSAFVGWQLTFWRRNYFFFNLAHSVYKMWIIQEPNTLELWNKLHFEERKNGEYISRLKYSVFIFVE